MKSLFKQLDDKMGMEYNTNFILDMFTKAWVIELCGLIEEQYQKKSDSKCPHCRKRIDMETK